MSTMLATKSWVTYAEDDVEAWKALGLGRSARKVGTRRQLAIIISDKVSLEMRLRMDATFDSILTLKKNGGATDFRIQAKDYFNNLKRFQGCVFIHPNCLMVKNSDSLFHQEGGGNHVVKDTKGDNVGLDVIIIRNGDGNNNMTNNGMLECVEGLDLTSNHLAPIPRKDVTIVYFMNGHPLDNGIIQPVGKVAAETASYFHKLCPELFNEAPIPSPFGTTPGLEDSIAIIGLAGRYPGANTLDEFWDLLIQGMEGVRRVPDDRWTADKALITADNTRDTEAGFLSCPLENFDAKFFNINGADATLMDPQQRMALRVVWEALEHACIDPLSLKGTFTGVFGGWWKEDYKEMINNGKYEAADFLRGYLGNGLGPLTARISHFFDFIGPAFSTESGCSTSIAGVDMGCNALRNEECHLAVCIGINLLLHPFALGSDKLENLLAPDGRCKVFDQSADGFGRAEGAGVVILKRFPDAVKDGDRIWGLIRGEAVVQEGTSKSMGTPTVDVEAKTMALALHRAGVRPSEVDFLEMHGTGTPVGDPIESAAVARVYSREARETPLLIGSVKGNTGHTESVCGITSIHKMVLAMKHEVIPQTRNLKNMMPGIALEFEKIPALVPLEPKPWKRNPHKARICAINSFGITGAQANIIVQEPPKNLPVPLWNFCDKRDMKILTFSGKFKDALHRNIEKFIEFGSKDEDSSSNELLRDIEYNMHVSRAHLYFRHVVLGRTMDEIIQKLRSDDGSSIQAVPVPGTPPKIGFLFTGQGSQYPGMGKGLYEQSAIFRSYFDWCDSILRKDHGIEESLKDALWGSQAVEKLKETVYSQIGIFVVEYCLLKLWESWGIKPDLVVGHSTGEFAACVGAGIMSAEDALLLVATRSKLINALPPGKMLVVMAPANRVNEYLKSAVSPLDIAAVNSGDQTVVAGVPEAVDHFKCFLDNNGTKSVLLRSSQAFHSRMMEPMLGEYEKVTKTIKFNKPSARCRYISSVEGREIDQPLHPDYFLHHTREKVKFVEASRAAVQSTGVSTFIEIGGHPVLSPILMGNTDEVVDDVSCLPSLRRNHDDWECMLNTLGKLYYQGVAIDWRGFHQHSGANKVDIPGYSFDETQKYWLDITPDGSAPFHPLVGKPFPNASGVLIFHNTLHLNNFGFLKDHLVQKKPIFLCAGYLEMLMAAFNYAEIGRGGEMLTHLPVGIKDFSIKVPILLDENNGTEFQVIVTQDPEGSRTGKIYTRINLDDQTFKWVENAEATATSSVELGKINNFPDLALLKNSCVVPLNEGFSYEDLSNHGLQFGPSLQNVTEGWRDPEGRHGLLFTYQVGETRQTEIDRFLVHPGITDPMLQMQGLEYGKGMVAAGGNKYLNKHPLLVPVQVGTFAKWSPRIPREGYFHVQLVDGEYIGVTYDLDGNVTSSITGVDFMETTINNILALIDGEKSPYPSMGEITWNEQLGPCEKRVKKELLEEVCFGDYEKPALALKHFTEEEALEYDAINEAISQLILGLFNELGLPRFSEFTWPDICETVGIIPVYQKYVRFLVLLLKAEEWFGQNEGNSNSFKILKPLPTPKEIEKKLELIYDKAKSSERLLTTLNHCKTLADHLPGIVRGEGSPLPVFFPENQSEVGIAEFVYTQSLMSTKLIGLLNVADSIISDVARKGNHVIRVLEVGAGVGSATRILIEKMVDLGPHRFEYTYTDLSSVFLKKGEELFAGTGIPAKFQIFNLEEDPMQQGLAPEYYDVVVASLVVHATRDIEEAMMNINKVLMPGGLVLMTELIRPSHLISFLFGALEGFWRFQDTHVRQWNCELDVNGWSEIMKRQGYLDFAAYGAFDEIGALLAARKADTKPVDLKVIIPPEKSWILLGNRNCALTDGLKCKLEYLGYSVVLLTKETFHSKTDVETHFNELFRNGGILGLLLLWGIEEPVTMGLTEQFLYICQYLHSLQLQYTLSFTIVTKGGLSTGPNDYVSNTPDPATLVGMVKVLANETQELRCKFVDYNDTMDIEKAVDSITSEIFVYDEDVMVTFRDYHRFVPRFKPITVPQTALTLPDSGRYQLVIPHSNMVSDLLFAPAEPQPVGEDEVEIQVKAYSLNFRDLLNVTKPDAMFAGDDLIGMDTCGVLSAVGQKAGEKWKVGDRVITVRQFGLSLPSHVVVNFEGLIPLPQNLTFLDGSTLPTAAVTVIQCLFHEIKVTKDDVVLVHTASGGVGLTAVHLLLNHVKCQVVVTAGTERKRNYLRGLGVKYVFNSRSTSYGEEIRQALGGKGVTVVLNSLTGQGFKEATLSLCERDAKFIEISKMNIWTRQEVREMRPDVDYKIVDVQTLDPEQVRGLNTEMEDLVNRGYSKEGGGGNGGLKPIQHVTFDCTEVRAAFDFMEKVQHVGKICIRMREPQTSLGHQPFQLFNKESSYLITGGLGGIGFEVSKWMVKQGAGTIILLGRSAPSANVSLEIEKLKTKAKIVVERCDVGNYEELEPIMLSNNYPPIRGIIHCAGVIDDDPFEKQTWERYERVFQGKLKGGWNLHLLSKKLCLPLEHFVLFSSFSSIIAGALQSNYAAANSYLDALGRYRVAHGLPALTINWGQWAQVGMAANLVSAFYEPFSVTKGMAALEHGMRSTRTNLSAYEADLVNLKKVFPNLRGLFADLEDTGANSGLVIDKDQLWEEYDVAETRQGKQAVIRHFLKQILRATLKLSPSDEIDDNREFQELGLDSLMMVEIKNILQATMKKRAKISISAVKDYNTVSLLSTQLVELISGKEESPVLTREEIYAMVCKDWKLLGDADPDPQIPNRSTLTDIRKVGIVLVTGATGNLGSYVVAQLAELPQIKKIYCLVRPTTTHTSAEKLRLCLMRKGLYTDKVKQKVEVLEGDVAKPWFSLNNQDFHNLAEQVEAVFHLAAKITFMARYKRPEDVNGCREVNVEGTRNVFKFAITTRLKHAFHTSTLLTAMKMDDERGILSEAWRTVEETNLLPDMDYPMTKFISEGLAEQISNLGVPVKVVRLPFAGPDSQTGGNMEFNHFAMVRAFLYMYLGFMPSDSLPFNMLPVDVAAKLSLQVWLHPEAPSGIYNVCNPKTDEETDFPEVASDFGRYVKVVEREEFKELITKLGDDDMFKELQNVFEDGGKSSDSYVIARENEMMLYGELKPPFYMAWLEGNKKIYKSEKVEMFTSLKEGIPTSFQVLKAALKAAKMEGLFDKFKIPYTK